MTFAFPDPSNLAEKNRHRRWVVPQPTDNLKFEQIQRRFQFGVCARISRKVNTLIVKACRHPEFNDDLDLATEGRSAVLL
jgi:hypothetical protein